MDRRDFLQLSCSFGAYATLGNLLQAVPGFAQSGETYSLARRLVWINMSGGWDLLETVDPKESSSGGVDMVYGWNEAHALDNAGIVRVGRWMPGLASLGNDVVLVRGLVMGTTSHDAGSTYMDTGILSNNGRVNAASIPAIVASESQATIPVIQLSGGTEPLLDRGLLKPLSVVRAQNLDLYRTMYPLSGELSAQRIRLLDYMKASATRFQAAVGLNDRLSALTAAELKVRGQIETGVGQQLSLTDTDLLPYQQSGMRRNGLAESFALAYKLLTNNLVSCVNMGVGGFDTHASQTRQLQPLLTAFDAHLKVFVEQLKAANQLDNTLIVLFSDFGRTPKVNNTDGRDHWPVGGAAFIGGGLAGGRAVGGTDNNMLAQGIDPVSGHVGGSTQINATHLGGSIIELTLGTGYLARRPYLTSLPALTRLKT